MVSNEERREVARKLRERTKKPMGKSMQRMFTETLGIYAHHISWMNPDKATNRWDVIVNYLADLIDRPTTKRDGVGGIYWRCTRCGAFNRKDAVTDCCGVIPSRYCANCGADVVEWSARKTDRKPWQVSGSPCRTCSITRIGTRLTTAFSNAATQRIGR